MSLRPFHALISVHLYFTHLSRRLGLSLLSVLRTLGYCFHVPLLSSPFHPTALRTALFSPGLTPCYRPPVSYTQRDVWGGLEGESRLYPEM